MQMNNQNHNQPLSSVFTDGFFRFLALILLFISLLYEQTNLILISILILAMFYTLKLWSVLSIRNIIYSFDAEKKKGFPGEQVLLQARIFNNKFLPVWLKLIIPIDSNLSTNSNIKNKAFCEEFSLSWYDQSRWQWQLIAEKRGCYRIGPPYLETGDLLGLFQQKKYLSQSVEMIIYPKPVSLNYLSAPVKELFGKPGSESPVKDPVYPVATRDYYHGSPSKYIHWKATARHNRLQTKVFEPSSQRKTLLIIDVSSFRKTKHEELFEKTLEIVASTLLEFDRHGSPYGIISNGKITGNYNPRMSIATGPEQLAVSMELLARLQMKPRGSMQKILSNENLMLGGAGCIYYTCTINKNNIKTAELLKQRHLPVYLVTSLSANRTNNLDIPVLFLEEIHGDI